MQRLPPMPIYRTHRHWYGIDTCHPQQEAAREGKIEFHAISKGHYPGRRVSGKVLPGLSSLGFWNAPTAQDWGLEAHRNEGVEIVFLETGTMAFMVDGHSHPLTSGSLTITRPWQLHKLGEPNIGPGRLYWLILDVGVRRPNQEWRWPRWVVLTRESLVELTRKLRTNEHPAWTATPNISRLFRELAECVVRWNQPHTLSRLTIGLNRLLLEILDLLRAQQKEELPDLTSRRRTVELFLHDLANSPASSAVAWTLPLMAKHCGMGVTAFSQYCRELVNNSAIEFLTQCRVREAARQLIHQPGKSVTAIALEAGFNSSQYFATVFRHHFHQSPRQYRQQPRT